MTTRGLLAVVIGTLLWSSASIARDGRVQTPQPAGLATIHVVVEDASGRTVQGLRRDDFMVLFDGWPVTLADVPLKPTSFSAVLIVDVTASQHPCPAGVGGTPSTAPRSAGTTFPGPIPPILEPFVLYGVQAGDRIRVGSLGRTLRLDEGFSADRGVIQRRWRALFELPPIEWLGPSPIWDAVAEAVAAVANQPGQRAVVLLSDGAATGNVRGRREVADAAALAGVAVSVVMEESVIRLPKPDEGGEAVDPADGLMAMAHETGGVAVLDKALNTIPPRLCSNRSPDMAMQSVLGRIHQAYALSFAVPVNDGRNHSLSVRMKRPELWVSSPRLSPVPRR